MAYAPVTAIVESVEKISPNFMRVVFSGPEMKIVGSTSPVFDQRIKLIFPNPGKDLPIFPTTGDWYPNWLAMPEDSRGVMRTYSIRSLNMGPTFTSLTVDFVLHTEPGLTGPAATWAMHAQEGDKLLILAPRLDAEAQGGIEFDHGAAQCIVLAGDETAAPAIARILEDLAASDNSHITGTALIEVPEKDDILPIAGPAGISIKWLPRQGRAHGERLLESLDLQAKLTASTPADGDTLLWETPAYSALGEPVAAASTAHGEYYWIAGESGVVTTIRRALIKEKGLDRSQVAFMGYWKRGIAMRG